MALTVETTESGEAYESDERQVVALQLADEIYGIDIAHINTVITPQVITMVPKAPPHIRGVINLRGRVIPAIDLRARFGLPAADQDQERAGRIVIVDVDGLSAGLIVDGVSEVLRIPMSCIDPPSQLVASSELECVTGIGRIPMGRRQGELKKSTATEKRASGSDERLIILLDVAKIMAASSVLEVARMKLPVAA